MTRSELLAARKAGVIDMHAAGMTNAAMADRLGIQTRDVANWLRKLGLFANEPGQTTRPGTVRMAVSCPTSVDSERTISVTLPMLPIGLSADPRHETEPRRRGLIGSRVTREVDHTDAIIAAIAEARRTA